MTDDAKTYTFDWRPDEHARVTSLLMREQMRSGVWRIAKWSIAAVVILGALLSAFFAMLGDIGSGMRLMPATILLAAWIRSRLPSNVPYIELETPRRIT